MNWKKIMFLFRKKEIRNQDYQRKEGIMKNLGFGSKGCLTALLCGVSILGLSIGNKVEATDINLEETKQAFTTMKLSEREIDIVDEIINGNFRKGVNYLEVLPLPKASYGDDEETSSSMLAYAYQVLGQHYIEEKDASSAATAYFRSLKGYPINYELTKYLNKLDIKNFSKGSIEEALNKILNK